MFVEAVINPTTFRICKQNRKCFEDDEHILQMLQYADYRGKYGYFVQAGPNVQITDPDDVVETLKVLEIHKRAAIEKIVRMHDFTMKLLEIRREE